MIGYLPCRDCGMKTNVADLTAKLCPDCLKKRTVCLSALQSKYEQAIRNKNADCIASTAGQVRNYQQTESVRLQGVPDAYRVR